MALQYDYDSEHSQRAMGKIKTILNRRRVNGATQSQIATGSGMTTPTVSRYMKFLVENNEAYEAGKTESPRGGKAVIYLPGPNPNPPAPRNRKKVYTDLPLAFFKVRTKMKFNTQDLSPWFMATDYRPHTVGPFECRLREEFREGKTEEQTKHFRWWDGKAWSFPLPFDPAMDDEILAPTADLMIQVATEKELIEDHLARFDWRGFNSDQEEL
jgi:hypothetical protein